jgi:hypothetical protein
LTETRLISDIKVGQRFRKDLGNLKALVNSIEEIGLLHPIVINENNELIAGQRRLEAYKNIGNNEVPVTIIHINDIIKGEFHENAVRKDFTVSERVAILEEIENKRIGHRPKKDTNLVSFQEENKGTRSIDIASKYTGISTGKLQMEKKIVHAARNEPEKWNGILKRVEAGQTSAIYAYKMIIRAEDHYDTPLTRGELPADQYDIILADLPWVINIHHDLYETEYPVLNLLEMAQLDIPVTKNAILFLWSKDLTIRHSIHVMKSWGFEYKTSGAWINKEKLHDTPYSKGEEIELLLIGEKGDMPTPEPKNRPGSALSFNERSEVRHMIESMYPNRRYLQIYPSKDTEYTVENKNDKWVLWGIGDHIRLNRPKSELDPALSHPKIKVN